MNRPIRLAIVSSILHHSWGGPAMVVHKHAQALQPDLDVSIFGVAETEQMTELQQELTNCHLFPPIWPRRWFRGAGLREALQKAIQKVDVVHAHMLWDHSTWAAWQAARSLKKPIIITPHGSMMAPWRYRTWHKRLYRRLILDKILRETTFLHVLNQQEADACQQAGVTTATRIISNGLEPQAFQHNGDAQRAIQQWPMLADKNILLYLGRLWHDKGLADLVEAWATLIQEPCAKPWRLVLAGPDYRSYRAVLLKQLLQLGIPHGNHPQSQVQLLGEVRGQQKADLLALASAFVLPSHSEGFSAALLEAMAAALPAAYTNACHFPELAAMAGGIETATGTTAVRSGMLTLMNMEENHRIEMGQRARQLAQDKFSMAHVAAALRSMYQEAIQLGSSS